MMQLEVVSLLIFGLLSCSHSAPREGLPLLSPGGIGGIFEGPDSETIIRGPDGSEITSEQKGGAVIRDDGLEAQPIIVAETELSYEAPVLTEQRLVPAGPIISSTGSILGSVDHAVDSQNNLLVPQSTQLLTGETYTVPEADIIQGYAETPLLAPSIHGGNAIEIVQQDPHIIETEIIDAPDVEPDQSSDLKGPSGREITRGSASIVSGPASTTITEPRRILIAAPKINIASPVISTATIPLREVQIGDSLQSFEGPLEAVGASSPQGSYEVSSTLAPPVLSYLSTARPVEYGYSTTATPAVERSYADGGQSVRIDLGANDLRQSIPVVEYSSLNGVVNEPGLLNAGTYSSTELPLVSNSINGIPADAHLISQATPHNLTPRSAGLVSSNDPSPYVQKIPRIGDNIAVNGRVDIAYPSNGRTYEFPEILGMALARFYQKSPIKDKDTVSIDDKMGDLSQNEITPYGSGQQFPLRPDLSQTEYIAPALARNGVDVSQISFEQIPLSKVTDGTYGSDYGFLDNRYHRNNARSQSY